MESNKATQTQESQDYSRGMVISRDKLIFSPPLYAQRYQTVQKIIAESTLPVHKVVDIGSSELKFFRNLQSISGVQDVVLLDIDMETLQSNKFRVQPLMADFILKRRQPLRVRVVRGDARLYDHILSGTQVVTLIEVIEHLHESDLPALVKCVFGEVKPNLVVVTTPNADFNKFFPNHTPGTFRHWDHKFEWTNEQFKEWCFGVVEEYREYQVEFSGCGIGPDGTFCTQIATFSSNQIRYHQHEEAHPSSSSPLITLTDSSSITQQQRLTPQQRLPTQQTTYEVVSDIEFPVDSRTEEEVKMDYVSNRFTSLCNHLATGDSFDKISKYSVLPWQVEVGRRGCIALPPYYETHTNYLSGASHNYQSHDVNDNISLEQTGKGDNTTTSTIATTAAAAAPGAHYLVPHYASEDMIYSLKDNDEYCFYVIDNRYAVIPMRSLAHWVNAGEETNIPDELISKAVENACFATQGKGRSWVGKVKLYQDTSSSLSSSSSNEHDCEDKEKEESESYKMWPSSHKQSDEMQTGNTECWD